MSALFRPHLMKTALAVLLLAVLIPLLQYGQAQASPQPQSNSEDCESCHAGIQEVWYEGAHSSAQTAHVLTEAMNCLSCHPGMQGGGVQPPAGLAVTSNGKMEDANCAVCHTTGYNEATGKSESYGITCKACHTPVENHPAKDMPINNTAKACGTCHSDTRFNWDNWKNSRHYRENMNCTECHDPHSTALHNVVMGATADKSALCLSCHEPDEHMSPYSTHGRAGISCVECHLGEKSGVDTFHVVPNHSFKPEIKSCSSCHSATIHRPAMPGENVPAAVPMRATATPYNLYSTPHPTQTPAPASLLQGSDNSLLWLVLAALTGVIGLIAGIVIPNLLTTFPTKKSPPKKRN